MRRTPGLRTRRLRPLGFAVALGLAATALAALLPAAPARADAALLAEACGACHAAGEGAGEAGGLSRISGQRKTPEGWLMTIVRMRIAHGLEISAADQAALVAWLADTQGLAPSETEGWRYALTKDPNHVEAAEEPLAGMCGRCHTLARVALQRRTADEWLTHMHFHVGQFPTVEYQALGRDRDWFEVATDEIAPLLAETWPLETEAWTAWQAAEKPDVTGEWVVLTDLPRSGPAFGTLTVSGEASPFTVSGSLTLADGTGAEVTGKMNLYTGYEWRANVTIDGNPFRQVLAVSEDGTRLSGRQFEAETDSLGGPLTGARADGEPVILGTVPDAAPAGEASVQVVGVELEGLLVDGADTGSLTPNAAGAALTLTGEGDGTVTFRAGASGASFAFYETIDRLTVEPSFTIARVGGGSTVGPAPVPARFRAIGWWNGPDGEAGTGDDVRVGTLPATWTVKNRGEEAQKMEDAAFAGEMVDGGIFAPAGAGPNPERPFSTNNAGDLTIVGEAAGLTGEAHLIVTVQRFIDPPIR